MDLFLKYQKFKFLELWTWQVSFSNNLCFIFRQRPEIKKRSTQSNLNSTWRNEMLKKIQIFVRSFYGKMKFINIQKFIF